MITNWFNPFIFLPGTSNRKAKTKNYNLDSDFGLDLYNENETFVKKYKITDKNIHAHEFYLYKERPVFITKIFNKSKTSNRNIPANIEAQAIYTSGLKVKLTSESILEKFVGYGVRDLAYMMPFGYLPSSAKKLKENSGKNKKATNIQKGRGQLATRMKRKPPAVTTIAWVLKI